MIVQDTAIYWSTFGQGVIITLIQIGGLGVVTLTVTMALVFEERVNGVLPSVTSAQIGDGTSKAFLSTLGIRNFDCCIVAIGGNFQHSLETTSLLKELGAKKVIAQTFRGVQEKFLLQNGADEVVYLEKRLAAWRAIRCTSEHILDYIALNGEDSIFELSIPEEWCGKTIVQLDIRRKYGVNILGIRENGVLDTNVTPDTLLNRGKSTLVLGRQKSI